MDNSLSCGLFFKTVLNSFMNNKKMNHPQKVRRIPTDQLIMGMHAICEVLRHAHNRLIGVYTSVSSSAKQRKNDLLAECEDRNIPVHHCSLEALTKMVGSDSHQSFVAHIKSRTFLDVATFIQERDQGFVLMVDQIFDPQNFGSLLRSAECFGVDGVVWSKNRGCDLTPMVAKASCGASELLPLLRISNLGNAVDQFKEANYEIIAALAEEGAESLREVLYGPRTVLIVGSEGEGIQPLLRKKADRSVFIPMTGVIESLNVAQAASIFLSWRVLNGNLGPQPGGDFLNR
jgi:23S rRNA (guanosine2251-2'-O)-methyltransferase